MSVAPAVKKIFKDCIDISLQPDFLSADQAAACLHILLQEIDWRHDSVRVFGRSHPIPRRHQWYADEGLMYRWSGITLQPLSWFPALNELRSQVSAAAGCDFNSVLCNLYRDGNDSMGWHADDEPELGEQPVIASLSLGAARDFQLRRKGQEQKQRRVARTFTLTPGSLLLMQGNSQRDWLHALPKRKRVSEPRINLTFRRILTN
ncbi:MAG: alpha-ketoglutarate-dependent dioxygenase AlkB family protein [Gammaproteobacteria bacterium]